MYTLVIPSFLPNSLKIVTRICKFKQYLGTKLDMQFEIAKSVEIVLEKQIFYPKLVDFLQKHCSVATFVYIILPKSKFFL